MSIKVNNDTANGSVEIKSPNVAGDYVVTTPARTCTMAGEDTVIGVGQTWQDVTGSRVSNTTYTNSTGKPIALRINFNQVTTAYFTLGSESEYLLINTPAATVIEYFIIIPNGVSYKIRVSAGSVVLWSELR